MREVTDHGYSLFYYYNIYSNTTYRIHRQHILCVLGTPI